MKKLNKKTNTKAKTNKKDNTKAKSGAKVSVIKKNKRGKISLTSFGKTVVICLSVVLVLMIAVFVSVHCLISYYYGLMNYIDVDAQTTRSEEEIDSIIEALDSADPNVTNSHESEEIDNNVQNALDGIEQIREPIEGVINILLIGVDNSGIPGDNSYYATLQNTDSMIVVSINEKTKKIVLTSLLRDSCVEIKRNNGTTVIGRLNTASLYGGYSTLFETIDRNFGIEVDKFVQVDFSSFIDIVNIVGGVDIYVEESEAIELNRVLQSINIIIGDPINSGLFTDTSAKIRHLNGKQALAYARIRYNNGSDFGRTERQRKLIMTVAQQLTSLNVSQLNSLLTALLEKVSTNLTQSECVSLMANAMSYLRYDMESLGIPQYGMFKNITVNHKEMLEVDFVANYKAWKELVTGS